MRALEASQKQRKPPVACAVGAAAARSWLPGDEPAAGSLDVEQTPQLDLPEVATLEEEQELVVAALVAVDDDTIPVPEAPQRS